MLFSITTLFCVVNSFLSFFFLPRGFNSDQGFLSWSLPLSEFYSLIDKNAFQILQANINAILSTLEAVGKTPDRVDEETKNLVKVYMFTTFVQFKSLFSFQFAFYPILHFISFLISLSLTLFVLPTKMIHSFFHLPIFSPT